MDPVEPKQGEEQGEEQGESQSAIDELRAELDAVKIRLLAIEGRLGMDSAGAREQRPSGAATGQARGVQPWLAHLAWACFVLGGALVLRAATRQGWLAADLGTGLGIAYGLALILFAHLAALRRPLRLFAHGVQVCGAVLVPLIVLETELGRSLGAPSVTSLAFRSPGTSANLAVALLAASAGLGTVIGARQRQASLVVTALMAAMVANGALLFHSQGALPRSALFVGIGAAGLWAAAHLGWPWLRPALLVPLMAVLSGAVVFTAHRPELPRSVGLTFLAGAVVLALLQVVTTIRQPEPDRFQQVSFPLVLLWLAGLGFFVLPSGTRAVGIGFGTLLLIVAPFVSVTRARMLRTSAALLLAAMLIGLWLGAPVLGLAALWLWFQAKPAGSEHGAMFLSEGLLLLAQVSALVQLVEAGTLASRGLLAASFALALICLFHALALNHVRSVAPLAGRLAGLSLVGTLLFALAARSAAAQLVGMNAAELAETLTLALGTLLCVRGSTRFPAAALVGLVALAALACKVLLWDLVKLDGGYRVVSVLVLGSTALATSIWHRLVKLH